MTSNWQHQGRLTAARPASLRSRPTRWPRRRPRPKRRRSRRCGRGSCCRARNGRRSTSSGGSCEVEGYNGFNGWWFGTFFDYFSTYWEEKKTQLTFIFFRGVETTNQWLYNYSLYGFIVVYTRTYKWKFHPMCVL